MSIFEDEFDLMDDESDDISLDIMMIGRNPRRTKSEKHLCRAEKPSQKPKYETYN